MTTGNVLPPPPKNTFMTILGAMLSAVDVLRRVVVNVIFIVLALIVLGAVIAGMRGKTLKDKTALVLDLKGEIVEQYSGSPSDVALSKALGEEVNEIQLRDLKFALEQAAKDDRISAVFLRPDELTGAGVSTLREVGRALQQFRASGKKVVAYSYFYDQRMLYLAAHADEVYLHPEGGALLEGLGRYRTYYRSMLDKLGVTMHVFRVGEYKSAVEPYLLDGPSPEAQEADAYWLNDLWNVLLADVAKARGLEVANLRAMIDELPQRIAKVGGNPAQLALDEGLVDALKTPDEIRALMIERGAKKDDPEYKGPATFRQVKLSDYVKQKRAQEKGAKEQAIGVIVAAGTILDGKQPPGTIGGDSTAHLIRRAREDQNIKAIVLRVDSPGGSGFASEVIRREMELTRAAGKPVVVSMGDLAASGGYWISMTSDAIYAEPTTITGSIGIFGLIPSIDRGLDKIGIHSGGTTTTWLSGAGDITRPLDPRLGEVIQSVINHGYQDFIGKVAMSRGKSVEEIDRVARGRVWSGQQAHERGLVDVLGGLDEAIADAARRAELSEYTVRYVEKELSPFEQFMVNLSGATLKLAQHWAGIEPDVLKLAPELSAELRGTLALLAEARRQPLRTYAHCFCEVR